MTLMEGEREGGEKKKSLKMHLLQKFKPRTQLNLTIFSAVLLTEYTTPPKPDWLTELFRTTSRIGLACKNKITLKGSESLRGSTPF